MASYDANIRIGVTGQNQIDAAITKINSLDKILDRLNERASRIGQVAPVAVRDVTSPALLQQQKIMGQLQAATEKTARAGALYGTAWKAAATSLAIFNREAQQTAALLEGIARSQQRLRALPPPRLQGLLSPAGSPGVALGGTAPSRALPSAAALRQQLAGRQQLRLPQGTRGGDIVQGGIQPVSVRDLGGRISSASTAAQEFDRALQQAVAYTNSYGRSINDVNNRTRQFGERLALPAAGQSGGRFVSDTAGAATAAETLRAIQDRRVAAAYERSRLRSEEILSTGAPRYGGVPRAMALGGVSPAMERHDAIRRRGTGVGEDSLRAFEGRLGRAQGNLERTGLSSNRLDRALTAYTIALENATQAQRQLNNQTNVARNARLDQLRQQRASGQPLTAFENRELNAANTRRRAAEFRIEQQRDQRRLQEANIPTVLDRGAVGGGRRAAGARRKAIQGAIGSAAIGGGFPLLFGQGAGAGAGGLLGGLIGPALLGGAGGFAGGIVGSLIGTQLDKLSQAATATGNALKSPTEGFQKLKEAGAFASKEQEFYIQRLLETGRIIDAQAEIQKQIISKVGVGGRDDLLLLASASTELSKAWGELSLQMQAAIAGPMADLLKWVTEIVKARSSEFKGEQSFRDVRAGLSDENKKKLDAEFNRLGGNDYFRTTGEIGKLKGEAAAKFAALSTPPVASAVPLAPAETQKQLQGDLEKAKETLSLKREAANLQREAYDIAVASEDKIIELTRKRADIIRDVADFERSIADRNFKIAQDIAKIDSDNLRKKAQLGIERTDLGLLRAQGAAGPEASGMIEAARQYLRIKGEGEAELQKQQRDLTLELAAIQRDTATYQLEVEKRMEQFRRVREDYTRDVSKTIVQQQRTIEDYKIKVVDYQVKQWERILAMATNVAAMQQAAAGAMGAMGEGGGTNSRLATLVKGVESGGDYGAYNRGGLAGGTIALGSGSDPTLTSKTIGQIMEMQARTGGNQIHAAGAYQIIGKTMKSLMSGGYGDIGGVTKDSLFSVETQDKLFVALARNRKTVAGLRQEWVGLLKVKDSDLQAALKAGPGTPGVGAGGDVIARATAATARFTGVTNECASTVKAYMQVVGVNANVMDRSAKSAERMGTVMTDWSKIQPGDIVARGRVGDPTHVGVYTGEQNVFHQSGSRGLRAGNYADLGYFKQQGYFIRPSGAGGPTGAQQMAAGLAPVPGAPTPPVMGNLEQFRAAPALPAIADLLAKAGSLEARSAGAKRLGLDLAKQLQAVTLEKAEEELKQRYVGQLEDELIIQDRKLELGKDALKIAEIANPMEKQRLTLQSEQAQELKVLAAAFDETLEAVKGNAELEKLVKDAKEKGLAIQGQINEVQKKILEDAMAAERVAAVATAQQDYEMIGAGRAAGYRGDTARAYEGALKQYGDPDTARRLADIAEASRGPQALEDARTRLDQLQDPINQIVTGANAIGNAFGSAFQDVITGSKSANEALADMFKGIASSFAQMAAEMLAQQAVLGILKLFGGALGGAPAADGGFSNLGFTPGLNIMGFADGGIPFTGKPSIVGEDGPELFVPFQAGQIIPNSPSGSRSYQGAGGAGGAAGPGGAGGAAGSGGAGGVGGAAGAPGAPGSALMVPFTKAGSSGIMSPAATAAGAVEYINASGAIKVEMDTTVINGVEYITADQMRRSQQQAVAEAQARMVASLKNNPSTRKQVGI